VTVKDSTPRALIAGTGSTTPKRILSNKDLESIVDTSDEWITRRTGIKERRISCRGNGEGTADLATQASLKAMEAAGIRPAHLDMIVVGTVTPDRQFPSAACMVQQALGAENAAAFDVSAGCSGFLYALKVVNDAIRSGSCKNALVIGAERLSGIVNWKDRSTCVLLGDGAGAVAVTSAAEDSGILSSRLRSDGSFWELLYASDGNIRPPEALQGIDIKPFHLKMEGNRLFKRAVSCLAEIARETLEEAGLASDDIALLVPHQANIRIIQAMANNLKIPMERVYTNIHRYGNTSSASIPIALDEAHREGVLKRDDYVLLLTFGAGLTWGGSLLKWSI
jgi:3-oxoacyl-[acyl-carrier-protein] synthase-3